MVLQVLHAPASTSSLCALCNTLSMEFFIFYTHEHISHTCASSVQQCSIYSTPSYTNRSTLLPIHHGLYEYSTTCHPTIAPLGKDRFVSNMETCIAETLQWRLFLQSAIYK